MLRPMLCWQLVAFFSALLFLQSALACKPAALRSVCPPEHQVKLDEPTYKHLEKDVGLYQKKLDGYLEKAFKSKPKVEGLTSCFNNHFASHYLQAIRSFGSHNKGMVCDNHLQVLFLNIDILIDQTSIEEKLIKSEKARLDLLDQAMEVSEALLYFKNKHTK